MLAIVDSRANLLQLDALWTQSENGEREQLPPRTAAAETIRSFMRACTIGLSINDEPRAVGAFIEQLNPVLTSAGMEGWRVDLSRCRYLGPDAAAIIGGTVLLSRRNKQPIEVILPTQPPALDAFCEFSGLKHLIRGTSAPDPSHPDSVTVPLRQISGSIRHTEVEPIFDLIRAHTELREDLQFSLGVAFNEVLHNVEDHAESPIGAISCARYLTGSDEVRVAVVDFGKGIATTLRTQFPDTKDARQALRRVIEGGYSAKSRRPNFRRGINNQRLNIARPGGAL